MTSHLKYSDKTYFLSTVFNYASTTLDRKRICANRSSYPNHNSNTTAQLCFRNDEMTSFFDKMYQYFQLLIQAKAII